eukprot:jgi/Chrpa1/988/Chrysochromulina_OHIO_Genome00000794-RA
MLKLQFPPDASVLVAFGLRVLEHVSTRGVERLAEEEPAALRRTPTEIHDLPPRWHFKGQTVEETEEERAARFAAFAAKRKAQAEKAAARQAASMRIYGGPKTDLTAEEALAAAVLEGLTLVPADNETGFKNVMKNGTQFQAQILEGGVRSCLGTYATPQQAALVVARHRKEGCAVT